MFRLFEEYNTIFGLCNASNYRRHPLLEKDLVYEVLLECAIQLVNYLVYTQKGVTNKLKTYFALSFAFTD